MRLICSLLFTLSLLFANIGTVVDSVGNSTLKRNGKLLSVVPKLSIKENDFIQTGKNAKVKLFFKDNTVVSLGRNTSFLIDSYLYTGKKDSTIKFEVLKGFFKTVTGQIGKIAPEKFKLKVKNATIGIRGTVFLANINDKEDVVICTDGTVILFKSNKEILIHQGELSRVTKDNLVKSSKYTQNQKEKFIKSSGWKGSMSLKELIAYIKKNFKEPLLSQLLETVKNILNKDSYEREKYFKKIEKLDLSDIAFVDDIKINNREFDSLEQQQIEFYQKDLQNGKVVINGLLESNDSKVLVKDLFVEITIDGGKTWNKASGNENWEWSFIPETQKLYEFSLRVIKEPKLKELSSSQLEEINRELEIDEDLLILDSRETISNNLIPKVIMTNKIEVRFKRLTPKVITTNPIELKFKKVKSIVVTTKKINLKFIKVNP